MSVVRKDAIQLVVPECHIALMISKKIHELLWGN